MFNFPKCPKCGNTLPIATGVCATCPISPLPGQEDQSARLAASAEVDQVEGTIPQIYQDFIASRDVLWSMVMSEKGAKEKGALMDAFSAMTILLLDRGYSS